MVGTLAVTKKLLGDKVYKFELNVKDVSCWIQIKYLEMILQVFNIKYWDYRLYSS